MTAAVRRVTVRVLAIGAFVLGVAGAAQGQQSPFGFDNQKPEPPKLEETIFDLLSVGPTSPAGVSTEGLNTRQMLDNIDTALKASPANNQEAMYWMRQVIVRALSDPDNGAAYAMRSLAAQLWATEQDSRDNMRRLELVWQLLAVAGDSQAMCNIGLKYKDGIGVAKDGRLARQWYERAEAAGCKDAAKALAELGQ